MAGRLEKVESVIEQFQGTNLALRYATVPVVAAVDGMALGGGCEIAMHCDKVVASLESYFGLVEAGVGLIPGAGGCKEIAVRAALDAKSGDLFPFLRRSFETVAMAQVGRSAEHSRELGFLRPADRVVMNRFELLYVAKVELKSMHEAGYRPPLRITKEAAMPVMEGKSILFKGLADIDAFPICLATQDTDVIIQTVRCLAPSFDGINLEDISAPRCFVIEDALQDLGIPVFHDDQHGTAIAVLAGVINSLLVTGRKIEDTKFVFAGAGAGGIASTKLLLDHGATNVTLVDSTGIISRNRSNLTPVKSAMLDTTNPENTDGGLADAMRGADVFIGLSAANTVRPEMVSSMAKDSIVFAMANPIPEIFPDDARAAGAAVVGTGRSDFPNQINNSLVFPGVFRGALDCHATRVTTRMKLAAATALAAMVTEPTHENVIPWSLDREVAKTVSRAVSGAV